MVYLEKECPKCGEKISREINSCLSCEGSIQQANEINTKYIQFSTASLVIGCLAIGFFSWFGWLFPYWAQWLGDMVGLLTFNSLFLICSIIGVVLGAKSKDKGNKTRANVGIVFNSIGIAIHTFVFFGNLIWYLFLRWTNTCQNNTKKGDLLGKGI